MRRTPRAARWRWLFGEVRRYGMSGGQSPILQRVVTIRSGVRGTISRRQVTPIEYSQSTPSGDPQVMYWEVKRWVVPIARVVGWPGFWLKLHVTGEVPYGCFYYDQYGNPVYDRFVLMFQQLHTNSWSQANTPVNINATTDPPYSLWDWDSGAWQWCRTQLVDFDLWFELPYCDTLICC